MKRFVAFLMVMVLCLMYVSSAMALKFEWDGSDTENFHPWSGDNTTTSVGEKWSMSWTYHNLSSTHAADVKIYHAKGVYASHTWTYKTDSTDSHEYLPAYANGQTVYPAGKKSSGTGNITVGGNFVP